LLGLPFLFLFPVFFLSISLFPLQFWIEMIHSKASGKFSLAIL